MPRYVQYPTCQQPRIKLSRESCSTQSFVLTLKGCGALGMTLSVRDFVYHSLAVSVIGITSQRSAFEYVGAHDKVNKNVGGMQAIHTPVARCYRV